jgi:signal transduction histidine kinase
MAPLLLAGVVVGVLLAFHASLPVAVAETIPASAVRPVVTGHPLLLAGHAVGALGFVVAAVAFSAQASKRGDTLLKWVGPACVLGAFSRLHYMLFPSIYSGWIYTGDLLRTASYLLLLVGAAREIGTYWRGQARLAVLDDRRRLARELHDGVVQELGYIRSEAHLITSDDGVRSRIVDSVDRATDEARAAIDTLGSDGEDSLGLLLHGAARQVAERYGGQVIVTSTSRSTRPRSRAMTSCGSPARRCRTRSGTGARRTSASACCVTKAPGGSLSTMTAGDSTRPRPRARDTA